MTGRNGSRFTTDEEALTSVLTILKERGLMYVDSAATSRTIALEIADSIQRCPGLSQTPISTTTQPLRKCNGVWLRLSAPDGAQDTRPGAFPPLPLTIDLLAAWTSTLSERGFTLVPVTAIANKQNLR